jgi:hypothetical protein
MSSSDAKTTEQGLSLDERRAFMRLPLEERRRRMADQAEKMTDYYQSSAEVKQRQD